MNKELVERLRTEADLCRNETAYDVAALLDEAAEALCAQDSAQPVAWECEACGRIYYRDTAPTVFACGPECGPWTRKNFPPPTHPRSSHPIAKAEPIAQLAYFPASDDERMPHGPSWQLQKLAYSRLPQFTECRSVDLFLEAPLPNAPIPDGWKLVPQKIEPAMWLALGHSLANTFPKVEAQDLWDRVLNAASEPPHD